MFFYSFPEILKFMFFFSFIPLSAKKSLISTLPQHGAHKQQNRFNESKKIYSKAQPNKFSKYLWVSGEIQSGRIEQASGFSATK